MRARCPVVKSLQHCSFASHPARNSDAPRLTTAPRFISFKLFNRNLCSTAVGMAESHRTAAFSTSLSSTERVDTSSLFAGAMPKAEIGALDYLEVIFYTLPMRCSAPTPGRVHLP
jgi:hypothetical protein